MDLLRICQTGDVKYRKIILQCLPVWADISHLDDELKVNVAQHLEKLECDIRSYFFKLSRDDLSLARNLFRLSSEKV